ncbi:hypothetical protein ACQUW5_07360 [Legionella sp. CNM-1927-20]|uniref:hypothetical protein n=1 Tax=Legionella sp. CNM-1927-20 TaxID=3422221 RepID=UPI00403ADDEE
MKRFFLILLLLPSLGFCSTVHYYAPLERNFVHAANMHGHNDTAVIIERPYRTYNVPAPSYYRYYHRHRSYPRYLYRGRSHDHYQERVDNYIYNGHLHGHR